MFELAYLVAGVALGMAVQPARRYVVKLWAARKIKQLPVVDDSAAVKCGACGSVIFSAPLTCVVTKTGSFKVYRCQQCATQVTVPF